MSTNKTIREEVVEAILMGFAASALTITTEEVPDRLETRIHIEGYPRPIRVLATEVIVPSEFEDTIHEGIQLDVATILAEGAGEI